MAQTKLYDKGLRGKLVTVTSGNIAFLYAKPELSNDWSRSTGPTTIGQATGYYWEVEGNSYSTTMIEVLSVTTGIGLVPIATLKYVEKSHVLIDSNPDYDLTLDTSKPADDGTPATTTKTGTTSTTDVVSDKPGSGIPVKDKAGQIVYVDIDQLRSMLATSATDGNDNTKKYLTYALYGIIGLSAVVLVVILAKSLSRKPKTQPQPKP